jgi:hypothetical protein
MVDVLWKGAWSRMVAVIGLFLEFSQRDDCQPTYQNSHTAKEVRLDDPRSDGRHYSRR